MTKELIYVDDENNFAINCFDHLRLNNDVKKTYSSGLKDVSILIKDKKNRAFIIDINLGEGRQMEGIEIIKKIRESDSQSLIIVYSAYKDTEEECRAAGANLFFEKIASKYDQIIRNISETIELSFVKNENLIIKNWKKETEIPAKFIRADNDFIYLNCMFDINSKSIIEKKFPKSVLENANNIDVDKSIMISIKEGIGRICYSFEIDNSSEIDSLFLANENSESIDYSIFNVKEE